MAARKVTTPLSDEVVKDLTAGEKVLLSGYIFTARDAAHRRLMEAINRGLKLPFEIKEQVIYYCGPSPASPGRVIGACGPTTSSRMDPYTPTLLALGLRGMIGKGRRSADVREAIEIHGAVYLGATGGAGALLSNSVVAAETIAYEDLGPAIIRAQIPRSCLSFPFAPYEFFHHSTGSLIRILIERMFHRVCGYRLKHSPDFS
ncbi:MAG TPA: fumarate hydratase C-terminal domain-containing protein, partial [Syntrophorhabdaceae bacterium]|nr:fumarate hydratase C-terminal domain-containing protein [Syntrophorhabdaceae bacterium]